MSIGYPFHLHQHKQYGRAWYITFHYLQFRCAVGIPFTTTNNSSMDVQEVSLCTTCSLVEYWVSLSLPTTPAVWTCRVYLFPLPAVWKSRVYPFHQHQQEYKCAGSILFHRQQCGCVCRVIHFHRQQYRRAGGFPFHYRQYGRAGYTTSIVNVQGVS